MIEQTPTKAPTSTDEKPHKAPPFHSIGYKVHNELTYRGVDWLLNSAIGVGFTYATSRTDTGKRLFSRPVSHAFETVLKPFIKDEATLKEGGKWGMLITSIMAGGTMIIPVMMALENKENKKAMIHKIDATVYGEAYNPEGHKFKQQDQAIDEESDKDFKSGMITRFAVLAPLIAMTTIPATNRPVEKHLYEPIGRISKAISKSMGIIPGNKMLQAEHEIVRGKETLVSNWDFLHRTIGFDVGLTMIYSVLHEKAYKALSAFNHSQHKHIPEGEGIDSPAPRMPHEAESTMITQNHVHQDNHTQPTSQVSDVSIEKLHSEPHYALGA